MLISGLLGEMTIPSASSIASITPGRRPRAFHAFERDRLQPRLAASAHEIVLQMHAALVGVEHGRHRIIAHRQHACADAERRADGVHRLR